MKTAFTAAGLSLLAVFLAYAFRLTLWNSLGLNPETIVLEEYGDMMLEARGLFMEMSEEFQSLARAAADMEGLHILRRADGRPAAIRGNEAMEPASVFAGPGAEDLDALLENLEAVFRGAEVAVPGDGGEETEAAHAQVLSISVTEDAMEFYTHFHKLGYVGICYKKTPEAGENRDRIELVEDWQIFYKMD
ncbi:MAG: hypothetical protein ACOX7I_05730 [Oscillospiraceae bacterium]|jgi:hypothetical protein